MNHFGFYLFISIGGFCGLMAGLILFGFWRHVKKQLTCPPKSDPQVMLK